MAMMGRRDGLGAVPRGVWVLGGVSLLMDLSSEMIHGLLPVFLVSVLGVSALGVGLIEGVAEATAAITKLFSGLVSDRLGRRKPLVLLGYGMAAATKPIFALATGIGWIVFARFADRVGKGIRGAPRDALVADLTPPALRGAAFGLRQSLDTVGAFAGPLLALLLMAASDGDFRLVFWLATVPALLCVLLIQFGVTEPAQPAPPTAATPPLGLAGLGRLPAAVWGAVAIAVLITLARFSEAFLLLRTQSLGLPDALAPLVLVVMNLVYAGVSYPVGRLSDRIGRHGLLGAGLAVLILADLALVAAATPLQALAGAAAWGLHMGMTQGLLSALVADAAPAPLRGTAFGLFHLASGVALLAASVIAGALWAWLGPAATFLAGAGFTLAALAGLLLWWRRR